MALRPRFHANVSPSDRSNRRASNARRDRMADVAIIKTHYARRLATLRLSRCSTEQRNKWGERQKEGEQSTERPARWETYLLFLYGDVGQPARGHPEAELLHDDRVLRLVENHLEASGLHTGLVLLLLHLKITAMKRPLDDTSHFGNHDQTITFYHNSLGAETISVTFHTQLFQTIL